MANQAINKLDQWHKTKTGLLVFGLAELALAYASFCLAVNLGNFLLYFLMAILFVGGLKNIFRLIGALTHGVRHAN
jgi:hypothetical protein